MKKIAEFREGCKFYVLLAMQKKKKKRKSIMEISQLYLLQTYTTFSLPACVVYTLKLQRKYSHSWIGK